MELELLGIVLGFAVGCGVVAAMLMILRRRVAEGVPFWEIRMAPRRAWRVVARRVMYVVLVLWMAVIQWWLYAAIFGFLLTWDCLKKYAK